MMKLPQRVQSVFTIQIKINKFKRHPIQRKPKCHAVNYQRKVIMVQLLAGWIRGLLGSCFIFAGVLNAFCLTALTRYFRHESGITSFNSIMVCIQCAVDLLLCMFSGVSSLMGAFIGGHYVCKLSRSFVTGWSLMSIRIGLNFFIATHSFVKILHPFLRVKKNSMRMFILSLSGYILSVVLLICLCQDSQVKSDPDTGRCVSTHTMPFPNIGFKRVLQIVMFVLCYLFPLTVALHLYEQILNSLRSTEDKVYMLAYCEITKTRFCDVILCLAMVSMGYMQSLIRHMRPGIPELPNEAMFYVGKLMLMLYPVVVPIYSLLTRRVYRKPARDMWRAIIRRTHKNRTKNKSKAEPSKVQHRAL